MERGELESPQATVRTRSDVWAPILYFGMPLDAAIADGAVELTGDRSAVEALFGLFPMPERVDAVSA